MQNDERDLQDRTKRFALSIIRIFVNDTEDGRKRRFSANNCCVPGRQWEQIIARPTADAAKRNGASGASDIDGTAARVAESDSGEERINSFAKCGDSLRELEETAYWLELLLEGGIVSPEKLAALRQECDELIAIFVTILKRSRDRS